MATIVIDSWNSVGLHIPVGAGKIKVVCPACSETRKNKKDRSLSINNQMGVGYCHHCQDTFVIKADKEPIKEYKKPEVKQLPLSEKTISFFSDRKIEPRVLEYFKITESNEWMYAGKQSKEGTTLCINFNYFENKELVNVKFRGSEKRFKMVSGAKLVFYNLDAIKNSDECIIVEGEIDALSAYQCNFFNCISVPNGASKGNQRLEYLDNCIGYFVDKKKIIIASDGDSAGVMLRDELIRRLGREVCWVVDYPEGTKDTNEVLIKYGPDAVRRMFAEARQLPIEGIVSDDELEEATNEIWDNGYPEGAKTGYSKFDQIITFSPGQVTTWTGIPGHGKSEFIDQIMTRLAARNGWRCGIFAPENEPSYQAAAIISKFVGGEMSGTGKITEMKKDRGLQFVKDHFFFMKVEEIDISLDGILELARELIVKKGINLLLIDPYNHIEHNIPKGLTETLYISKLMSQLKRFAKLHQIHIFLVAHPTKIQKNADGKYKVPTLYDISGSANFYNKTYNGACVYRNFDDDLVEIHVPKVKFKWNGSAGACNFQYEISTGRYAHPGQPFENELDRYLHEQLQVGIPFEEPALPPIREPGQLSDFNSMKLETNFDYKPLTDPAPF